MDNYVMWNRLCKEFRLKQRELVLLKEVAINDGLIECRYSCALTKIRYEMRAIRSEMQKYL